MLWRQLVEVAGKRPTQPLFLEEDRVTSHEELLAMAARVAGQLAGRGVRTGDAVGLLARGGSRIAACTYGILGAGGAVVPLNPAMKPGEIARSLSPCRPRLILCEEDLKAAMPADTGMALGVEEALAGPSRGAVAQQDSPLDPERAAFFLFSTGSTGRPKRLLRSHAMMRAEARQYQAAVRLGPDDLILGIAPLFHSYGICCVMLSALESGARARLLPEFRPEVVMEAATRERATVLAGSPFHYSIMAGLKRRAGTDLSSIRWAISCGAPAPEAVLERFRRQFGVPVRQLYGASEVGSVTFNDADDPVRNQMSNGRPLPGVSVRIVDGHGAEVSPGVTGEICVRSAAASRRYEDLEEMTAQCFRSGWFHSGDLGRLDAEGNLYVTGRVKLLINAAGNKVDPLEVEATLQEHAAVLEAAVVGVPAAHGLESVKAAVVLKPGATVEVEELRAFCAERLVGYKVPRIVEFRDELPRSPTGKLLRKDLLGDPS